MTDPNLTSGNDERDGIETDAQFIDDWTVWAARKAYARWSADAPCRDYDFLPHARCRPVPVFQRWSAEGTVRAPMGILLGWTTIPYPEIDQ